MNDTSETQRQLANAIRLGTIAELDLAAGKCRVNSGEIKTDFIPWWVPRAGNTIEWSAPSVGEQVIVLCPGGDTHGAVALRGGYSDGFPAPDSSDTRHLTKHKDGAIIEYDDSTHALKATLPAGATAELTADAGITFNGPFTVNGDSQFNGDMGITGTANAQTDVIGGGKSLKNHGHTGVQTGGGVSGPPQ